MMIAIFFISMSYSLYSSNSNVVLLNSSNFNKEVVNSGDLYMVEFYAPWCGHCKNLVPEWEKAAKALKGIVKIGAVDADADKVI
jgi:protein disulfide-isomerase A6